MSERVVRIWELLLMALVRGIDVGPRRIHGVAVRA